MQQRLIVLLLAASTLQTIVDIENQLPVKAFYEARQRLQGIAFHTPLLFSTSLSEKYDCNVFVKREDLQVVRSYKIRGAYNKMVTTPKELLDRGVVCASAGNHAQGVAFACAKLKVQCKIFMPVKTPNQKINKVRGFGREFIEIILIGKDFDEAFAGAKEYTSKNGSTFVETFNDLKVITG